MEKVEKRSNDDEDDELVEDELVEDELAEFLKDSWKVKRVRRPGMNSLKLGETWRNDLKRLWIKVRVPPVEESGPGEK